MKADQIPPFINNIDKWGCRGYGDKFSEFYTHRNIANWIVMYYD